MRLATVVAVSTLLLSHTHAQLGANSTEFPWIINTDPSFTPSTPDPAYVQLLSESLYFYEAQRSGKLPADNRVPWRHDSGLQDGSDQGVDLTGGYYDAGDYLKFTFPLSFTLSSIAWGALDWGNGYDMANQTVYFEQMMQWGTDWLIKTHPNANTVFVQVGLGDVDNNYWGPDTNIPTPRPSFQINSTAHGTDAAAMIAAAFASSSMLYNGRLNNATYGNILLQHAKDAYAFAESTPLQTYQTAVPQSATLYGSSGFGDDLAWGALWLYRATNDSTYYQKAVNYYTQFALTSQQPVFNWDSTTAGLYVLLAQTAATTSSGNLTGWQTEAEQYFDSMVSQSGPNGVFLTPGGLLFFPNDSPDASLNPALNVAMLMLHYLPYASSQDKASKYSTFAINQINYALGANPMKCPYVVGVNPNAPQNPHHAGASGGADINNIDTSPPTEQNVLWGAVIGGPDDQDRFDDKRSDFDETEVALDYNAPLQSIAAYLVMNGHSDPPYTKLPAGSRVYPNYTTSSNISKGGAIAIAVIVVVFVLVIIGLGFWYRDRIRNAWHSCFGRRSQNPVGYLGR